MQKYQLFLSCGMIMSGLCSSALGGGEVLQNTDNSQFIALAMKNIDQVKSDNTNTLKAELAPHFSALKKLLLKFAESGQPYDLSDYITNQNPEYMQDWEAIKQAEKNFQASLARFNDGRAPTEKMKALQLEIESIQKQIEDLVFSDSSAPQPNSQTHDFAIQKEDLLSKRDAATHQLEILKTQIQAASDKLSEVTKSLRAAEGIHKGLEIRAQRTEVDRKAEYTKRIDESLRRIEGLNSELKDFEQAVSALKEKAQRREGEVLQYNKALKELEEQVNLLEETDTPRHAGLVEKRGERNRLEKKLRDLRLELRQEREAHSGSRETRAQVNAARNELNTLIDQFLNKYLVQENVNDCHLQCAKLLVKKAQSISQGLGRCTVEPKAVAEVMP